MLTPARVRSICAKIEKGVPQTAAAGSLGIPKRTLDNWLAWGRAEGAEGIYHDFAAAVDKARAKLHESRATQVMTHAEKDPRSAMFLLERRFPEEWADHTRAGGDVNIHVTLEVERRELAQRMLEAAADVLADDPDLLERLVERIARGAVVDGEAAELPDVAELEP